jgi:multidrug efflux pump subunit AcrA (membrane-fusion protein)
VVCIVDNPGHELIPGTNVDATIRTSVVEGAIVIPKEALRRDAQGDYVFVLAGDTLERRAVKTGHASITHVEIATGLAPGDAVALPSDLPLAAGQRVTPTGL